MTNDAKRERLLPTEIEITPAMIDVGEKALLEVIGGAVTEAFWSPRDLAVKVFLAMSRPESVVD